MVLFIASSARGVVSLSFGSNKTHFQGIMAAPASSLLVLTLVLALLADPGSSFTAVSLPAAARGVRPLTRRWLGFDDDDDDDDLLARVERAKAKKAQDEFLPDISSREGIGAFKEKNDFLAIAGEMGLVSEEDMAAEREKARAAEEAQRKMPKASKFDDWMGGLMAGTGQGIDADDRRARGEEDDEDDILVRLARRVEERRAELEQEGGGGGAAAGVVVEAGVDEVTSPIEEDVAAAAAAAPKKRKRKRKDAGSL